MNPFTVCHSSGGQDVGEEYHFISCCLRIFDLLGTFACYCYIASEKTQHGIVDDFPKKYTYSFNGPMGQFYLLLLYFVICAF